MRGFSGYKMERRGSLFDFSWIYCKIQKIILSGRLLADFLHSVKNLLNSQIFTRFFKNSDEYPPKCQNSTWILVIEYKSTKSVRILADFYFFFIKISIKKYLQKATGIVKEFKTKSSNFYQMSLISWLNIVQIPQKYP